MIKALSTDYAPRVPRGRLLARALVARAWAQIPTCRAVLKSGYEDSSTRRIVGMSEKCFAENAEIPSDMAG
jgi:hypothetical protein